MASADGRATLSDLRYALFFTLSGKCGALSVVAKIPRPSGMPIPAFNSHRVLPPFLGDPTHPGGRSPYPSSMEELVARFATSPERKDILRGLLDYRQALLHELPLTGAIQWLDGSFVEDIESAEARAPGDIDVLTIAAFPPSSTLSAAQRELLDPKRTKPRFRCDAYPLDVANVKTLSQLLGRITYWFGLFSHRRDGHWKGLVAVPLDEAEDLRARARLDALS